MPAYSSPRRRASPCHLERLAFFASTHLPIVLTSQAVHSAMQARTFQYRQVNQNGAQRSDALGQTKTK